MKPSVCMNCGERTATCHGECERYLQEREELREFKDDIYRKKTIDKYIGANVRKNKDKVAKKKKIKFTQI